MAEGRKWYSASSSFAFESGLVTTWLAPLDKKKSMSLGNALPVIPKIDEDEHVCIDDTYNYEH